MDTFAIVKLEVEHDIVSEFNSYLQRTAPTVSFVQDSAGYFRFSAEMPSSAGISEFGNFLLSTGYSISAINSGTTKEGEEGTTMSFAKNGKEESAVLSTVRIY
ncbi:MAG: hypothetical protein NTV88_06095 [Candidatus Micrarchaeota archaeon]|nr:hypothetical protein [Candidatus Micrarchaeota archaeon]